MFDDVRIMSPAPVGDDRSPPRGLPPDAPLAMPLQVIEGQARPFGTWLRSLLARAG